MSLSDVLSGLSVDVCIPAHNEETLIRRTILSVYEAFKRVPSVNFRIIVGLDHCTDSTSKIVDELSQTLPVSWIQSQPSQRGKWNMLMSLVAQSRADWVALVDAGSIWHQDLGVELIRKMSFDSKLIGLAPSYQPMRAGILESLNWWLEQKLKKSENVLGGPVSVHGATMLYHRQALVSVLGELPKVEWLNDDVSLPLALRFKYPKLKIEYLTRPSLNEAWVSDLGVRSELKTEYNRRSRMVMGNIQWIKMIFTKNIFNSLTVSFLTLRRISRLFWAYWALFGVLGLFFIFVKDFLSVFIGMIAASIALVLTSQWMRRVCMAFLSGLRIPMLWAQFNQKRGMQWN